MILYKTIEHAAHAEQVIDRSRFIAYASPASTKEEADAFIATIRKQHKDATHNVPAIVIGDKFQLQWASDDGEPQGTSGAPIVQMLVKEGITNTAIVVTRYFGGIKLGTGGLVRAYTSSAKLAVEASGICGVMEMAVFSFKIDYAYLSKIQNLAGEDTFQIDDIQYEDVVTVKVAAPVQKAGFVKENFANITAGNSILISEGSELLKKPF